MRNTKNTNTQTKTWESLVASVVLHHKTLVQDKQLLLSIPDAALGPVIIARNTEKEEEEEQEEEGGEDDKLWPPNKSDRSLAESQQLICVKLNVNDL